MSRDQSRKERNKNGADTSGRAMTGGESIKAERNARRKERSQREMTRSEQKGTQDDGTGIERK
jgi:hypothetical protein